MLLLKLLLPKHELLKPKLFHIYHLVVIVIVVVMATRKEFATLCAYVEVLIRIAETLVVDVGWSIVDFHHLFLLLVGAIFWGKVADFVERVWGEKALVDICRLD